MARDDAEYEAITVPEPQLPEPVRSQITAMMAVRDARVERQRADQFRDDSNKLYELRGWLRLCADEPAGHSEFYRWACHYIFGDAAPMDLEGDNDE